MFATHLHELFSLPLSLSGISYKRMGISYPNIEEEERCNHEQSGENSLSNPDSLDSLDSPGGKLRTPQWTFLLEDGK